MFIYQREETDKRSMKVDIAIYADLGIFDNFVFCIK